MSQCLWIYLTDYIPKPSSSHVHAFLFSLPQFNPELVLVSAGFDAAWGDPLGGCHLSPEGYAHLTHLLMGLASGRIILILEVTPSVPLSTLEVVGKTCSPVLAASWLQHWGRFPKISFECPHLALLAHPGH